MQARPPQQAAAYMDYATFEIPAFLTQGGTSLDLKLAYTTQDQLFVARDNAILALTSYSAQHDDAAALFALMSLPGTKVIDSLQGNALLRSGRAIKRH